MGLGTLYNSIISAIETDLKTITEFTTLTDGRVKVFIYKGKPGFKEGECEATIVPGEMTPISGVTSHSTWNEFTIYIDMLYYRHRDLDAELKDAFLAGLTVAEKVYDKFHLKTLSGLVKLIRVTITPGEGALSQRNIEAIPFRVELRIERPVTQI
jgi:hypothetical protein